MIKLVFWAFFGGWISGALGLGGGAIYNPLLLGFGVAPSVTTATGMYMILVSTSGSSTIFVIYKMLDVGYGVWVGMWCCMGGVLGLYLMKKLMLRFDRQSPIVFVLFFLMIISACVIPFFAYRDTMEAINKGKQYMEFTSIC